MMFAQLPILGTFVFHALVSSYYIDKNSCESPDTQANVKVAVDEAVNVARYAAWRVSTGGLVPVNGVPGSDIITELLGTNDGAVSRFEEKMRAVPGAMGQRTHDPNDHVVIKCGDEFMIHRRVQYHGHDIEGWQDRYYPTSAVNPGDVRPCSQDPTTGKYTQAFTYSTGNPPGQGTHSVIVLCNNNDNNAEARFAALRLPEQVIGPDWSENWNKELVDYFNGQYLSRTILHEIMHNIYDPPDHYLGDTLPSGSGEVYGWNSISAMTNNDDKIANADGYAILAFVLYTITSQYSSSGEFGRQQDFHVWRTLIDPSNPHPGYED